MRLKSVIFYIFTFCILGFFQKSSFNFDAAQKEKSLENIESFLLSEYENTEERYIDFNCASISQGERTVSPSRNSSNGVSFRILNNSKRSQNSDSYITNSGKIIFTIGATLDVDSLQLYPSGLLADRSFFISLRKFFV